MNEIVFEALCKASWEDGGGDGWDGVYPDNQERWRHEVRSVLNALGLNGGAA